MSGKLIDAITKHIPIDKKDLEQETKLYKAKKESITDLSVGIHDLFPLAKDSTSIDQAKYCELVSLLHIIEIKFVLWLQKLITPPVGNGRVFIGKRIEKIANQSVNIAGGDLIPNMDIGHQVYYM